MSVLAKRSFVTTVIVTGAVFAPCFLIACSNAGSSMAGDSAARVKGDTGTPDENGTPDAGPWTDAGQADTARQASIDVAAVWAFEVGNETQNVTSDAGSLGADSGANADAAGTEGRPEDSGFGDARDIRLSEPLKADAAPDVPLVFPSDTADARVSMDGAGNSVDVMEAWIPYDAGLEVAATPSENLACESQLLAQWTSSPPAVGFGSQNSAASYDRVITGLMAKYGIPGGSVAVSYNGRLMLARAYGFADTASHQPAHPGHLFRLASVSKQITATVVLELIEAGKLALDAPAFSYLPNLLPLSGKVANPALSSITIRHLLSHTGGWNRDSEVVGDPMFDSIAIASTLGEPGPASANDTIRYMLDKPLTYTPGTTYCYSNLGYAILGAIVEQVTGTDYQSYVNQHVLAPQHISDMVIGGSLQSQAADEEVTYYDYPGEPRGSSVFPAIPGPVPLAYGAFNMDALKSHGGWIASTVDMLRFTAGVNRHIGPTLISSASLSSMLANPNVPSCNTDGSTGTTPASTASWYGLGFQVNQYGNYWHTGSLPGTSTEDVVAGGYSFAAFFNTRPQNSSQLASDLDGDLWTAFNGVTTWSSEDFADQFGSFTAWMSAADLATETAAAHASQQYPSRIEGRLQNGVSQYRARFVPLHSGTQAEGVYALECVSYQAAAAQYDQLGLGLASLQTFVGSDGLTRYQATWETR